MRRSLMRFVIGSVVVGAPLYIDAASAYDTGSMSCDDIGHFAAAAVEGKQKGMTEKEALSGITKTVPASYRAERHVLRDIVHQLYTAPYANHLSPDGAFAAYKADCEAGQQ